MKPKLNLVMQANRTLIEFSKLVLLIAATSICFQSTANATPTANANCTVDGNWMTAPSVFNIAIGPNGLDQIPGTLDDRPLGTIGIFSGYKGGTYCGPAGVPLGANVVMDSWAFPVVGGMWQYNWFITNHGTGPFVKYVDTGGGPLTFLQDDRILWGTAGWDRIPLTKDDEKDETDSEIRIAGGPPIIGFWGGAWNPEVAPDAMRVQPVPEPSTLLLFGIGVVALISYGRRRNQAI